MNRLLKIWTGINGIDHSEEYSSSGIAKERINGILKYDRANMSPKLLDMIKQEVMRVMSDYMVIDEERLNIQVNREGGLPKLVFSVPIKKVKDIGR